MDMSDSNEAVADGVLHQVGGGLEGEGFEDAGPVELGGAGRDLEQGGHLLGGTALSIELEDFALAGSELVSQAAGPGVVVAVRLEELAGNQRGHVGLSLEGVADGSDQLGGGGMLE